MQGMDSAPPKNGGLDPKSLKIGPPSPKLEPVWLSVTDFTLQNTNIASQFKGGNDQQDC